MDIYKIAWMFFVVGVGLACLAWIGSVPAKVQWFGAGIALVGAVLSLFGKSKKGQKGPEEGDGKTVAEEQKRQGEEKKVDSPE